MSDAMQPHSGDDVNVNVETKHESSDVNVRALFWFVVVFILFAAASHAMLWLLFRFYVQIGRGEAANAPLTSVAMPVDSNIPALPRLQPFPSRDPRGEAIAPTAVTPATDMAGMRSEQDQALATYGWVDQQHGVVHIPIEAAKQLALQSNIYAVNTGSPAPAPVLTETTGGGSSVPAASTAVKSTSPAANPTMTGAVNGPPQ